MTVTEAGWRVLARTLAERLATDGVLDDPAWRAAVEEVPRHVFVPYFYDQRADGGWTRTDAGSPSWLETVYDDVPLVTTLATTPTGSRVTVSSSTKPGLMLRMLAALDVHDGDRILEIGTGTGYNAGLLAHRLGDGHVYSVDVGAQLVDAAGDRLASLGYAPLLVATDGAHGLPDHAPYDKILATCSVPAVPWAWAKQLRHGGAVLVDLKRGSHAGNLVLLSQRGDRLEGRFLPRWAAFMAIRGTDTTSEPTGRVSTVRLDEGSPSSTRLDPHPWVEPVPWFLAASRMPRTVRFGYLGMTDTGLTWAVHVGDDGSWCAVRRQPDARGLHDVLEHGPIAIWTSYEQTRDEWLGLGRPGWDRLGLTVMPDGQHRVWLDDPDGTHRWDLPTAHS